MRGKGKWYLDESILKNYAILRKFINAGGEVWPIGVTTHMVLP